MDHSNDPRFLKVMLAFAEQSGKEPSELKISIYAHGLADYTIDQIEQAAWKVIKGMKYPTFPQLGEIIEAIAGNPEDTAAVEAMKVYKAIRHVGGYQDVVFDNPTTQAVIMQGFGGWSKLCGEMTEDQQKWFLKDFAKLFISFSHRGVTHYGKLDGRGQCSQPQLVGDRQIALAVLHGDKEQNRLTYDTIQLIGSIGGPISEVC